MRRGDYPQRENGKSGETYMFSPPPISGAWTPIGVGQ